MTKRTRFRLLSYSALYEKQLTCEKSFKTTPFSSFLCFFLLYKINGWWQRCDVERLEQSLRSLSINTQMHAFYSILLEGSPFNNKFVFDMLFICLFTCRLFLDTLLIKFVVYHESYFCIYSFKRNLLLKINCTIIFHHSWKA